MGENKIKKILVIRYEHIGDYGLTISPLASIKEKFPGAQIDIVVGPWNKHLAEATPCVSKVIVFDNPLIKRNISYLEILKIVMFKSWKIFAHLRELGRGDYDLLINFSDRKFSVLEHIVSFLKKEYSLSYREIGKLLRRNERTVWTTYQRSRKKGEIK